MLLYSFVRYKYIIRKMSVFAQRLNPLTGRSEWEKQPENYDYHQEVARSAFADMLHDKERNQKYELALKLAIDKFHSEGKKANVLDIGTGTGLLSMMAVRCGADTITACEAFEPMAKCAHKIIEDNGMAGKILIIPKRSTEIKVGENGDMKYKANILITEVFDTELIGEGALETFSHAHKFLLENDCIVVPNSGKVYAQLVECNLVQSWNKIKSLADDDGMIIIETPPSIQNCAGSAAVHDIQLSQLSLDQVTRLSEPILVKTFDWSGKTELVKNDSLTINGKCIANGTTQAVFMWWTLSMDFKSEILLSCAPFWAHPDAKKSPFPQDTIPWRDHWMQAVYYIPNQIFMQQNENFKLLFSHDEYSMWFNVIRESSTPTTKDYCSPICDCATHCAFSRTRIGQLNDGRRNKMYLRVLKNNIDENSVCLILSDGSLLGLAAVKMGAKHVYCLETNFLSRQVIASYVEHNKLGNRVTIIDSIDKIQNCASSINLVFAEPHFITSILPWDNAYFAYIKEALGNREDLKIIPNSGEIWMMPAEFRDLHKIRAPLNVCEGLKMDAFDSLIENASNLTDSFVEPQPLWEYPNRSLATPVKVLDLTFKESRLGAQCYSGKKEFSIEGICNGIILWIDWNLDGDTRNVWSTGPTSPFAPGDRIKWDMCTRQGVHLLQNPARVEKSQFLQYNTSCNINNGELHFGFKILET